jgi:hypothetical protein
MTVSCHADERIFKMVTTLKMTLIVILTALGVFNVSLQSYIKQAIAQNESQMFQGTVIQSEAKEIRNGEKGAEVPMHRTFAFATDEPGLNRG